MSAGRLLRIEGSRLDLEVIGLREPSSSDPALRRCLVFPFDSLLRQNSHMVPCGALQAYNQCSLRQIAAVLEILRGPKHCCMRQIGKFNLGVLYELFNCPSKTHLLLHQTKPSSPDD